MNVGDVFSNSYYSSLQKGQEIVSALSTPSLSNIFQDVVLPYIVPILFFVILAPGLLISIPPTSRSACANVAPLPADVGTGRCAKEIFLPGDSEYTTEQLNNVCQAQQKCHQFGMSGTVTIWSALVHGFVYVIGFNVILYVLTTFMNKSRAY